MDGVKKHSENKRLIVIQDVLKLRSPHKSGNKNTINSNIGCIETGRVFPLWQSRSLINSNIGCIETIIFPPGIGFRRD